MPNIASKLVPTFTGPALDADRLEGQVPVTSGGTGVNSLTQLKQNLSLDNVDNTSDANKPVSTAQATAISTALATNLANFDEKLAETEAARDEALSFGDAKVVTYWLEADALSGLTNGASVIVLATDTGFHPAVTGDIGVIAGQTPNSGYYKYSGGLAKLVRQGDLESSLVKTTSEQVAEDATRAEAFAAAITTVLDNYVSDTIAEGLADTSIPNGTYFPVITADGRHFLVKKINSSTSGTIVEYNTVIAFEEATAIVEAARDEALGYGSAKVVASWTEAAALTGLTNGYPVFVLSVDTGTHTAVSGDVGTISGQTPNAGYYRYSTSLTALVRVANLESSLVKGYRDTTKAYLDAVSTMLNGYIFTSVAEGLASSEVPVGTFFLVVDASNRYYAVYKDVGSVAGQTIEFATAFSGVESPRVRASYTVLAAESGWVDNQIAMVTSADTGTHASVAGDIGASGGQTPNRGHYRYSTALGKLVRQGDLESVVSTANKNLTEAYAQTLGTMFDGYIYQTTAEGLADPEVPNGTFFPVITTDNRRYDVYKVNSTTAGQIIEYPTTTYLDNTHTKIADLASSTAGKGAELIKLTQGMSVQKAISWTTPEAHGAVGDGTTDDTTAFSLLAAAVTDGTTVRLKGKYVIGSKITFTANDLTFDFDQGAKIIKKAATYTVDQLLQFNGLRFLWKNGTIDGNLAGHPGTYTGRNELIKIVGDYSTADGLIINGTPGIPFACGIYISANHFSLLNTKTYDTRGIAIRDGGDFSIIRNLRCYDIKNEYTSGSAGKGIVKDNTPTGSAFTWVSYSDLAFHSTATTSIEAIVFDHSGVQGGSVTVEDITINFPNFGDHPDAIKFVYCDSVTIRGLRSKHPINTTIRATLRFQEGIKRVVLDDCIFSGAVNFNPTVACNLLVTGNTVFGNDFIIATAINGFRGTLVVDDGVTFNNILTSAISRDGSNSVNDITRIGRCHYNGAVGGDACVINPALPVDKRLIAGNIQVAEPLSTTGTFRNLTTNGRWVALSDAQDAACSQMGDRVFLCSNSDFPMPREVDGFKIGDRLRKRSPTANTAYETVCVTAGIAAPAWAATTAYAPNVWRANGSNVYICTTAGTSAGSGGPTGTGTGITDGTVVWSYLGPLAVFKTSVTLAA